jgi:hypothetical protein
MRKITGRLRGGAAGAARNPRPEVRTLTLGIAIFGVKTNYFTLADRLTIGVYAVKDFGAQLLFEKLTIPW